MTSRSSKSKTCSWPSRALASVLVAVQVVVSTPGWSQTLDQLGRPAAMGPESEPVPSQERNPPTVSAAAKTKAPAACAEAPSVRKLLSTHPTDREIASIRLFRDQLLPIGKTTKSANRALPQALIEFSERTQSDDAVTIPAFLDH